MSRLVDDVVQGVDRAHDRRARRPAIARPEPTAPGRPAPIGSSAALGGVSVAAGARSVE
jgi:hypothetical protein